jgi:hypothetical protein
MDQFMLQSSEPTTSNTTRWFHLAINRFDWASGTWGVAAGYDSNGNR